MDAARNPERNLSIKVPAENLNRQENMTVASVGVTKLQAENNPDPNGTDKRRSTSLCYWMLAQAYNLIKNYRSLS